MLICALGAEGCSKRRASWVCDQEGNESGRSDSNTGKRSDGEWINDWKIASCTVLLMLSLNQNIASLGGGWLLLSQLFGEQAIEI
jgi:hypothetical protein